MKIGVIGLGNIFQKAYLPVISENRDGIEYYFATKNNETKIKLRERYGFTHFCSTLDELIEEGIEACFIHSATVAHFNVAKKCLELGIHVFMDKPLSESFSEASQLLELARDKQLVLMTGLNRRFAPSVGKLKSLEGKRVIYLEKNREFAEFTPKFAINDMFLHLVDTAVYLLDSPNVTISYSKLIGDDVLEYAVVHLETDKTMAIVSMDMKSGAHTEIFRATSPSGVMTVTNLSQVSLETPMSVNNLSVSDWTPTLATRGFDTMVTSFLEFLKTGDKNNLKQENILLSHFICEKILLAQS